jgi:crossover junction endodeoxyribonuclease RuvC
MEGDKVLLSTIKSKPSDGSYQGETKRLKGIVLEIEDIVSDEDVDIVALEGLAFMARNTTALVQLSGLNYMVRAMLEDYRKKFLVVAPSTLKKFVTGKGNSPKDVIMLSIFKKYGQSILDNNQADAFALAKCAEAFVDHTDHNKNDYTLYETEVLSALKEKNKWSY